LNNLGKANRSIAAMVSTEGGCLDDKEIFSYERFLDCNRKPFSCTTQSIVGLTGDSESNLESSGLEPSIGLGPIISHSENVAMEGGVNTKAITPPESLPQSERVKLSYSSVGIFNE